MEHETERATRAAGRAVSRREVLWRAPALSGALALAACSQGFAGTSASGDAANPPGSAARRHAVRIMGTYVDQTQGERLWNLWKAEIAAKEPGVDAEFVVQPKSDVADKLLAQVAAGDAPDVIQGTTIEYAVRGLLADLTPLITQDKLLASRKYFKKPVAAARFNTKFWAMPGGLSAYVFWVNLDMLKSAGVAPPKNGVMTFDEFIKYTQAVTKDTDGDGKTDQWGYDADSWFSRMPPLIWANGGDMFEYNAEFNLLTRPTWDRAQTWEAIQWQADLVTKHRISPSPSDEGALKASTFENGKRLFSYGGGWKVTDFRTKIGNAFQWSALRTPVKKPGDRPHEMVPAFMRGSILKDTKVRDAAWKALRYISGPEGNVGYRTYVTDELIFDTPEEITRYVSQSATANMQVLVDAARDAGERPFYKSEVRALFGWASEMVPAMNEEFKPVYEGRANAKEAVTRLQPRLAATIAKGKELGFDPNRPVITLG